uniref:Alpha N-terminal protein methyltransferase 1 n=1 Tax=Globodera rostochiensis TaxID=31243 RepID=A0A914HNJ7_GLORO
MPSSSTSPIDNAKKADAVPPEENYEKAYEHWNSIESDLNGMLGGFQRLHLPDINASKNFLFDLQKKGFLCHFDRSLDCGCGIASTWRFVESLHTFVPKTNWYDLIWVQWVTGQLEDKHLVEFLKRCKDSIRARDGCIVVKDNVAIGLDKEFDEAECRIVLERKQLHFPKRLYEVRMDQFELAMNQNCLMPVKKGWDGMKVSTPPPPLRICVPNANWGETNE